IDLDRAVEAGIRGDGDDHASTTRGPAAPSWAAASGSRPVSLTRTSRSSTLPKRANISIVEPDGTVTKINEPGPELTADEFNALTHATLRAAAGADWLAASGSLPPGAPPDFYARLIEL